MKIETITEKFIREKGPKGFLFLFGLLNKQQTASLMESYGESELNPKVAMLKHEVAKQREALFRYEAIIRILQSPPQKP